MTVQSSTQADVLVTKTDALWWREVRMEEKTELMVSNSRVQEMKGGENSSKGYKIRIPAPTLVIWSSEETLVHLI